MPDLYDVLAIAAVVDELSETISHGRIQRIGLADPRTIGMEIYAGGRRHYLIASADDRLPRLRLASDMPSLDTALITPFGLLLRKYARGGVILGIDQPPLERLARISIAKRLSPLTTTGEGSPPGTAANTSDGDCDGDGLDDEDLGVEETQIGYFTLYVELMGRRSNLILVDDNGRILESAKRVTSDMSRVRTVLPRQPYASPPPLDRGDPRAISADGVRQVISMLSAEADVAGAIVNAYRGISPTMAREIVYRVSGSTNTIVANLSPDAAELLSRETLALLEPLRTSRWSPCVYRQRNGEGEVHVLTFAAIPMSHLAKTHDEVAVSSISAAAESAESSVLQSNPVKHAQRRQRLLQGVTAARERAERRLVALEAEGARATAAEHLKRSGELIYAYVWQIGPGQTELHVEGETIPLDPQLSPSDNAQAYFERYRKAQSAGAQLPALAEESRVEIAYLDQLATLIAQAPGFAELEGLAAEWAERSEPETNARPRRKSVPRRPKALHDATGNTVFVGRSGSQNDLLTFDFAGPDDTWLHARGVPGSHVIIRWRSPDTADNPATIEAAAALAAWNSAARESNAVEVDVAPRRYVRKIKGAGPGMVTYRHERTIRVQPAPEERLRDILGER